MREWRGSNRKGIGILRVSSHRQKDNISHDTQEKEIREYCARHRIELSRVFKIVESAKDSDNRKQYSEALASAISNDTPHILFYMYDREARNLTDNEKNEKLVRSGLLIIHYVRDGKVLHKDSPDSEFFIRDVQAAANKQFIRNLAAKVSDAMREKAEQGWYPGNHAPLGYAHLHRKDENGRIIPRGTTIGPDPDERRVRQVQREFELRAQGVSYEEIRRRIISEGLIPENGLSQYRKTTIERRLKNVFYWGRFVWDGIEYEGKHPKIIPDLILRRVQATGSMRGMRLLARDQEHGLFQGWLRCAECGCLAVYDPKTKRYRSGASKTYHYYHCTNGRGAHSGLSGMNLEERDIWRQFDQVIDAIQIPKELAESVARALNDGHRTIVAQATREIEESRLMIQALETKEDRLFDSFLSKAIEEEDFRRMRARLREERDTFQRLRDAAKSRIQGQYRETAESVLELCTQAKSLYLSRPIGERREFLEMILSNPRLNGRTIEYDLKKPFQMLTKINNNEEWRALIDEFRTCCAALLGEKSHESRN